jgi:hypothetical protein
MELEDCRVPNCPNCNWPEIAQDGQEINVRSLINEMAHQIELQTGISVMVGFDCNGKFFVRTNSRRR